jgi:hypothetical protein
MEFESPGTIDSELTDSEPRAVTEPTEDGKTYCMNAPLLNVAGVAAPVEERAQIDLGRLVGPDNRRVHAKAYGGHSSR